MPADHPLTPALVLAEPAGRRLDALIGYHLFGWRWRKHLVWDVKPFDRDRGVRTRETYTVFCAPDTSVGWLSEPLPGYAEWDPYSIDPGHYWWRPTGDLPRYSSDIAAAWVVVEWLREHDYDPLIDANEGQSWHVQCDPDIHVYADTVPLAICRAALLALAESPS